MATTPVVLVLSQPQIDTLTELGIDHTKLYMIDNDELTPQTPPIKGFAAGHHVVFFEGEEAQHRIFLSHLYGFIPETYKLLSKFRDIYAYGSPTARFVTTENLASITIAVP